MNRPSDAEIAARIQAMIHQNIAMTGLHIQGVLDNPPFAYSIGLLPPFGFEIISIGLPPQIAFEVFNSVHASLLAGLRIQLGKVYTPKDAPWVNFPVKFIQATHPFLFSEWMIQAENWWGRTFPVYQWF